jgi:hypothetical protein
MTVTAVCIRKCIFEGRLWNVGETYAGEDAPPRHFQRVGPGPAAPEAGPAGKKKAKETDSK